VCAAATALCLLTAACAQGPAALQSAWPVASVEATVAPPADALRYPLTGLSADDEIAVARRPLCVKVVNSGAASALAGVQTADVVYETADTGTHTQLACLFQSRVPRQVAPVGAAGMPDLWIVPQYAAALFSTGAPATLSASIVRAGLLNLSQDTTAQSLYSRRRPSSVALDGPASRDALIARESDAASQPERLRYSSSFESSSDPISQVSIPFSTSVAVGWTYDAKHDVYRRFENRRAQIDMATRKGIVATNVVVLWAHHTPLDPDVAGGGGFDVTLGGSGQVSVFRGGRRLDGKWKADGQSPPRFVAENGSAIKLAPGNTWVEVIPLSTNITLR